MRDEQLEKIISEVVTPSAWSTPSDLQMAYIVARDVALAYKNKLEDQEPVAWRITAKRFCGNFTKERDVAQYWLEKEPESIKPLYLAPSLSLEPSDELIAEIKAMAGIRLIDGRVELSNVKEIIHAIVHHSLYAN